jgi:sporulation protein YlmC with PRC-barrel domain
MYWYGSFVWGTYSYVERDHNRWGKSNKNEKPWDHHLRSTHEVRGYHIQARDGEIGHVEDFILDDENWAIRYLVVNTQNWWPGKKVLISPKWIERVSWRDSKVFVNFFRDVVRHSPEYTDESVIVRAYENGHHSHYNRPGYWVDEASSKEHAS